MGRSWLVRVGLDAEGLGGVTLAQEIDSGAHYDLTFCAIARRLHGQGIGQEMLEDLFRTIVERSIDSGAGETDVKVGCMIHRKNTRSQKMCSRAGFACVGPTADDDDHMDWVRSLPLPAA